MMQQRIIRTLIKRNVQGWGRPLAYTEKRLRTGALFGIGALIVAALNSLINGPRQIVQPATGSASALFFVMVALLVLCASFLWTYLLPYLRATRQPHEEVSGTVDVAICNAQDILPVRQEVYHFITLRKADGTLRAFAIDPAQHQRVCQVGQRLTVTLIPGIEQVIAVE
jgi:uncharacterized protein (DUF58 family)